MPEAPLLSQYAAFFTENEESSGSCYISSGSNETLHFFIDQSTSRRPIDRSSTAVADQETALPPHDREQTTLLVVLLYYVFV